MENKYWRYLAWIIAALLFMLIGYIAGYTYGFSSGVQFAVKIGLYFVDIDINEDELVRLVKLYQFYCENKEINQCLEVWKLNTTQI